MTRALPLLMLLAACTQFPQVDAASKSIAPAPALLPMDELIAQVDQTAALDPLAARIAALRARADALRNQ